VHLADPVSNAAAGISAALRDLVFQYAAEVIRLLVKVSVKLLSGPVGIHSYDSDARITS
jgi:hypothetical protein